MKWDSSSAFSVDLSALLISWFRIEKLATLVKLFKKPTKIAMLSVTGFAIAGCATTQPRVVTSRNAERLMERPDANEARNAAPYWCKDALDTIIDLETQIKIGNAK